MEVLRRDYLPEHLEASLYEAGFDGSVVVQARQTEKETAWLLELAGSHPFIRGVVGWVPLVDPRVEAPLERYASDERLVGVRHLLQDETDDAYMLRDDFNRGVSTLRRFGLVYDVLVHPRHLENVLRFVDRHPDQPFVVDHVAKPIITARAFDEDWARGMRALAERPQVTCKLSGMVTEVRDATWSSALLGPYVDVVLEAFGPRRIMVGTDWPVCLLRCSYVDWVRAAESLLARLSSAEGAAVWGGTARRVYGL
jgi:L-fuconolactonase